MNEQVANTLKEIEELSKTLKQGIPDEYKQILGDIKTFNFSQISASVGKVLCDLILSEKKQTILELGTSAAYSTIWFAAAAQGNNGEVFTIERDEKKIFFAEKHIKQSRLTNITLIKGDIIESLSQWNKKIDFVFIDAEKSKYLQYLKILEPFLKENAIIVADNIDTIGGGKVSVAEKTKEYSDYVQRSIMYETKKLDLGDGLLISKKL